MPRLSLKRKGRNFWRLSHYYHAIPDYNPAHFDLEAKRSLEEAARSIGKKATVEGLLAILDWYIENAEETTLTREVMDQRMAEARAEIEREIRFVETL